VGWCVVPAWLTFPGRTMCGLWHGSRRPPGFCGMDGRLSFCVIGTWPSPVDHRRGRRIKAVVVSRYLTVFLAAPGRPSSGPALELIPETFRRGGQGGCRGGPFENSDL